MGSKMAAASRVVQVVKPHTPLIKFPDRSAPKLKIQDPLQSRVPPLHASSSQVSAAGGPPSHQNMSYSGRIQGTPDTAELVRTLPPKYRRKSISTEEMEYIQRFSVQFQGTCFVPGCIPDYVIREAVQNDTEESAGSFY